MIDLKGIIENARYAASLILKDEVFNESDTLKRDKVIQNYAEAFTVNALISYHEKLSTELRKYGIDL